MLGGGLFPLAGRRGGDHPVALGAQPLDSGERRDVDQPGRRVPIRGCGTRDHLGLRAREGAGPDGRFDHRLVQDSSGGLRGGASRADGGARDRGEPGIHVAEGVVAGSDTGCDDPTGREELPGAREPFELGEPLHQLTRRGTGHTVHIEAGDELPRIAEQRLQHRPHLLERRFRRLLAPYDGGVTMPPDSPRNGWFPTSCTIRRGCDHPSRELDRRFESRDAWVGALSSMAVT